LTAEQEQVLSTLKQSLSEAKLYIPAIEGKKATHDDPTLLYVHFATTFFNLEK